VFLFQVAQISNVYIQTFVMKKKFLQVILGNGIHLATKCMIDEKAHIEEGSKIQNSHMASL